MDYLVLYKSLRAEMLQHKMLASAAQKVVYLAIP